MKLLLIIVLPLTIFALVIFRGPPQTDAPSPVINTPTVFPTQIPTLIPTPLPQLIYIKDVPFASQAPFGDWKDPRQQDGCEEAASLLAVMWARDKSLTKDQALTHLLAIAEYQKDNFGQFTDTSAVDTEKRIIRGYFKFENSQVVTIKSITDLIAPLSQGKLIIVPTNGQLLNNPNFTAPGPERHNLVIRGYDRSTKEFITNDPGTRKGENYRYQEKTLFDSIRDYPTGEHSPITSIAKTAIVVWK